MALFLFAFLAGIATALSPCILPILPIILSSSVSKSKTRPIALVIGLIISFTFFTLMISKIIGLLGVSPTVLRTIAVGIIGLLGVTMLFPKLLEPFESILNKVPNLAPKKEKDGWLGGIIAGASLGLVWTPCAGPILASITALVATEKISLSVVVMVLLYSIGAGLPLLIIAYGGQRILSNVSRLNKSTGTIRKAFGVLTICTALLMGLGLDATLVARVTAFLPTSVTGALTNLESSTAVKNSLNNLDASGQPDSMLVVTDAAGGLPNLGTAPEFTGITSWLNSSPLTLAQLKGKVVLIDFWTYSCINCLRTLPYIKKWDEKYRDKGLVIIGIHTPEFAFEKDRDNVAKAIKQNGVTYPVAQDNAFGTWQAYSNRYWPAHYFIDGKGNIRHTHFGEGEYEKSEKIIQDLLKENGVVVDSNISAIQESGSSISTTSETYVGLHRQEHFASLEKPQLNEVEKFTFPESLPSDHFAVAGSWKFSEEYGQAENAASLRFNFTAKDVYLVMESAVPSRVTVTLKSGAKNNTEEFTKENSFEVKDSRLYHLVSLDSSSEDTVEIGFVPGVKVYAFTFG